MVVFLSGPMAKSLVALLISGHLLALSVALTYLPSEASELIANNNAPVANANLGEQRTYTVAEAGEISKASPNPNLKGQVVFYYDASMNEAYIYSLTNQLKKLHSEGYYAIAIPGGPKDSVQVMIAGKTSSQLIFSGVDIFERKPQNYGATFYKKLIGSPESHSVNVAD